MRDQKLDAREPGALTQRASWVFLACAFVLTAAAALSPSDQLSSFAFNGIALAAAAVAVYAIVRNQPPHRAPWLLIALGITLSAAGDVVYDLVVRVGGHDSGYPFADLLYLPAYPCFAIGMWRLAGRRRRDTTVDSAIVALAASAVIWKWVITPVLETSGGSTLEHLLTVAYPVMDVILVIAIVHAVFTLPRWITAARLLFSGLAVMLFADVAFARLVADSAYVDGGALDALWPIAYSLLAAAMLHPSMRDLWEVQEEGLVRSSRARIVVLGAALFCAPAVVVIEGAASDDAVALTVIVGATAALVAWRLVRLVTEANEAREEIGESEARFRALVQHSTDAVTVVDAGGVVTYVGGSVHRILGYRPDELIGVHIVDLMHPDDLVASAGAFEQLVSRPLATEHLEVRVRHADGSWRWLDARCTNQLEEPAILGIVGNFRDVTERKKLERAGVGETRVLELVLNGAPIGQILHILLQGIEDLIGDAAAIVRLLDPETGQLRSAAAPTLPLSYVRYIDEDGGSVVDDAARATQLWLEPYVLSDVGAEGGYGELRAMALAHGLRSFWSLPIRTADGDRPLGFLGVYTRSPRVPTPAESAALERARDLVSIALDRAAHTERLGFLALHDTLTALPNRALAVNHLDGALHSLPDSGPYLAVLFLDLDRFKVVNDGLGHDAGDELLVAVSRRLAGAVRGHDTVARFGGDEFVVICESLEDEQQAVNLAERALGSLRRPFALARAEVVVSASVGIALTHRATDRASSLLRDADAAMYRAKSKGGGRYELFDQAMHTQAVARLLTERSLRQSLENQELRVLFQPQLDLPTRTRVATEALLRWEHPVRGLVAPIDFMLVAEETGLIVPIGEWVMEEVCRRLRTEVEDGGDEQDLPVSVNVSARQLLQVGFVDHVRGTLRDFQLEAPALCLEVAERSLLVDHDAVRDALHSLKDLGVRLAIDDFGTGGSSLTYLRRYPFDELKIDGTFVAGLGRSSADDAIVAATIDMAHAVGMTVAAEGIETEAQLLRLIELGCERGQGFHLAPPEPATARHLQLVRTLPA